MSFCILEKDEKTFDYFKKYVGFLEENERTCLTLDNEIQSEEIQDHLRREGFGNNGGDPGKKDEISRWIKENARPFRDYLNSIKIAYVVWKCMGKDWKDITWEEFVVLEDRLNQLKYKCLDTIF
jgi:hypothetical protein